MLRLYQEARWISLIESHNMYHGEKEEWVSEFTMELETWNN